MKVFKCLFMMLLLAVFVTLPVTGADEKPKHSPADYQVAYSMLEAMNTQGLMQKLTEFSVEMLLESNPGLISHKDELKNFCAKYINFDAVKKGYADVYLDLFTVDELKELTLFFKTPLGKKLALNSPQLSYRLTMVDEKVGIRCYGEVQKFIKKLVSENKKK